MVQMSELKNKIWVNESKGNYSYYLNNQYSTYFIIIIIILKMNIYVFLKYSFIFEDGKNLC